MHACVCGTCYVHVLVYVCLCVNNMHRNIGVYEEGVGKTKGIYL